MIEIKHVSKLYHTRRRRRVAALRDINLTFGKTGMVFIVGKSGSGKSTLLNMLSGLDTPSEGQVLVNGRDVAELSPFETAAYRATRLGFIFQDFHLIDHLTVAENVAFSLSLQAREDPDAVAQILADVGLAGYGERRICELSGGECQRVAIARALIKSPDIILADEPTGNLDSKTSAAVLQILKTVSEKSLVVIVSHNISDAYRYGDRIVELRDGEVIVNKQRCEGYRNAFSIENGRVVLPYNKQLSEEELTRFEHAAVSGSVREIIQLNDGFADVPDPCSLPTTVQSDIGRGKSMPFRALWGLLWRFMRHQKAVCTVTVLLSALLVTLFALVQSFLLFDEAGIYTTVFQSNERPSAVLYKGVYDTYARELKTDYLVPLSPTEEEGLLAAGYEGDIYRLNNFSIPVSSNSYRMMHGEQIRSSDNLANFYLRETYGTLICDSAYLQRAFGGEGEIEVLAGDLTDTDGIVITDYVADSLIYYQKELNTYSDLIGELTIASYLRARVTAVVKTDYRERYDIFHQQLINAKKTQNDELLYSLIRSEACTAFFADVTERLGVCYTLDPDFLANAKTHKEVVRLGNCCFYAGDTCLRKHEDTYVLLSEEALPENGVVMDYTLYNRLYGTQYTTKNLEEFTPHTVTLSRLRPYADIDSRPIFEKEIEITALSKDKGLRTGQALYQFFADHELLEYALCLPDSETLGAAYESIAAQHLYTGVDGYELATNITKIVSVFEEFFALIVVFVVLVSLLVVFFFANIIVRKNRKSIGIMQALGQRTADALRVFAYQILLVLGISAALTVGTYFWLVRWGNGVLQSTFYRLFGNEMVYDFTLLRAGVGVILIDLAVLLLVAACSVGVEMLLLKRVNVIEVIRSTD
ncbi:MAG: ABC transporter ATP-binding protein [Clostridia bacterium]|nr:ABC transporter ATP-binding protein [Clostridia bacterium]